MRRCEPLRPLLDVGGHVNKEGQRVKYTEGPDGRLREVPETSYTVEIYQQVKGWIGTAETVLVELQVAEGLDLGAALKQSPEWKDLQLENGATIYLRIKNKEGEKIGVPLVAKAVRKGPASTVIVSWKKANNDELVVIDESTHRVIQDLQYGNPIYSGGLLFTEWKVASGTGDNAVELHTDNAPALGRQFAKDNIVAEQYELYKKLGKRTPWETLSNAFWDAFFPAVDTFAENFAWFMRQHGLGTALVCTTFAVSLQMCELRMYFEQTTTKTGTRATKVTFCLRTGGCQKLERYDDARIAEKCTTNSWQMPHNGLGLSASVAMKTNRKAEIAEILTRTVDVAATVADGWLQSTETTFLDIGGNSLHRPLPVDICNLKALQTLYVGEAQLEALPEEIENLTRLRELEISFNNQLTTQDVARVTKLTWLEELHVCFNNLRTLPDTIGNLTKLRKLNVSSNKLPMLPDTIVNLTELRELDASNNRLAWTSVNLIMKLTQLEELHLDDNLLASLPDTIGNLTRLRKLYLNKNTRLASLPTTIGNLVRLEELWLHNTRLASLPTTIVKLTELRKLRLDNNTLLTALPADFGNLVRLQELWLRNTRLSSLPTTIVELTELRILRLDDTNQLTELPTDFGNLVRLEELWLNNNRLASLPDTFVKLTELRTLRLDTNQLTELPTDFGNLVRLKELGLNNNRLTELPATFANLPALHSLYLRDNRLALRVGEDGTVGEVVDTEKMKTLTQVMAKLPKLWQVLLEGNVVARSLPKSMGPLTHQRSYAWMNSSAWQQ